MQKRWALLLLWDWHNAELVLYTSGCVGNVSHIQSPKPHEWLQWVDLERLWAWGCIPKVLSAVGIQSHASALRCWGMVYLLFWVSLLSVTSVGGAWFRLQDVLALWWQPEETPAIQFYTVSRTLQGVPQASRNDHAWRQGSSRADQALPNVGNERIVSLIIITVCVQYLQPYSSAARHNVLITKTKAGKTDLPARPSYEMDIDISCLPWLHCICICALWY